MTGTESGLFGILGPLLPPPIVTYDTFASTSARELPAAEEESVRRAVPERRREFATGRHCARQALAGLGLREATIPVGPNREPCWPPGIVGSITHTAGYCAAAAARSDQILAIGIDAEVAEPLPEDVLPIVTTASERLHLSNVHATDPNLPWGRLLFAAKEAVYKAWFPRTGRWLDFQEVEVVFHPELETFTATVPGLPMPEGPPLSAVTGRWACEFRLLLATVAIGPVDNPGT